jgi:hypothetical protein
MAANPTRKPGSDLGRSTVDWEQAFAFYGGLPEGQRSYGAVADEFEVSLRTVETHGRVGRWGERLRAIKTQAAEQTDGMLGQARVEQISKTLRLIDASLIGYADKLRRGEVRMTPADLERLHKLHQQLGEQLDETPARSSAPAARSAARSPEHTAAVIEALRETRALEPLGLREATSDDEIDNDTEAAEM